MSRNYSLAEIYREAYFHEISVWHSISGSLQLIFAVIVFIVGINAHTFTLLPPQSSGAIKLVFSFFFSFSWLYLIVASYHYWQAWHGLEYKLLPVSSELEKYKDVLVERYRDWPAENNFSERFLNDALYKFFMDFSTENAKSNEKKLNSLHLSRLALIPSIIFALVTFGFIQIPW